MKKLINKLHLILGLTCGLVVFIVGFTGAIYCWEEDVRNILYSDLYTVDTDAEYRYAPIDAVVDVAKRAYPDQRVKFLRIDLTNHRNVEVGFKNKESVFVDAGAQSVLGSYNRDGDFFGIVLQLHRRLMLGDAGEIITGISCLIFGFMLLSGIFLWWPRSKSIRKQRFRISIKAPRARKIFDLHSVLGFYASWILIISVVTGLVWSFKWFEKGMYALLGSEKNEQRFTSPLLPRDSTFDLNDIIIDVQERNPEAEELFVSLPDDSIGSIRVNALLPQEGFFKNENQLFYSQYTGHVVGAKSFSNLSTGDKLKSSNFDIHTGRKFGLAGKLIMFFASLIAASLPITGFLYWRTRVNAAKYLQKKS